MTGGLFRLLQMIIFINGLLILGILSFTYYMNIEILSQYSLVQWIFSSEDLVNKYIVESNFSLLYQYLFIIINIVVLFWFIKNFKYLNLSYALGLYNQVKQLEGEQKNYKVWFDRFKKKKKYKNLWHPKFKMYSLYFKNWVSITPKRYEENKKEIAQYLGWDGEIEVYQWGKKGVELFFFKLPNFIPHFIGDIQKGYINYGLSPNGKYRIRIDKQTHLVCVGESGSGKSNFMHHLLQSFIANDILIDEIELVDLKGTELYRYRHYEYMNFIDDIEKLRDSIQSLKEEMNSRFRQMKVNNDQMYKGKFRFVLIDEIGTIGTHPNKKFREEIFNLMIELFQKGRAAKIVFFIFAQKIDSTNIPSNVLANIPTRVLMKTDSDFNINNSIGTKESLEKITLLDPDSFPHGRAILKDGMTSQKTLIQVPFIEFKKEYR